MKADFDRAWLRRALAGDASAVRHLAEEAIAPLYGFCLYRVGRKRHLCEEVVQETMTRAIAKLGDYDPARAGNNIYSWLTGMARNEIHRVLAREKSAVSLETLWANMDRELLEMFARMENEPFSQAVLARQETQEMVNAAMSQLPPQYRETLEAKYIQNQSMRQIAASQSMSEKAVESQLSRARAAFRAAFLALARNLNIEPAL